MRHGDIHAGRAALERLARRADQRPAGRGHVVEQHDRASANLQFGKRQLHLRVAEAHLAADRMLELAGACRLGDPLPRLLIRSDQHRARHLHGDEAPELRRRRQRDATPARHHLVQAGDPVQVRVDSHHTVELRRQQRPDVTLADRLARREFHVLPHVGEVGRDQHQMPHAPAPRGRRGDQQLDQAVVGLMLHPAQQDDVARQRLGQHHPRLPVRETMSRDDPHRAAQLPGQPRGQVLFVVEAQQHRRILASNRGRRACGIPADGRLEVPVNGGPGLLGGFFWGDAEG